MHFLSNIVTKSCFSFIGSKDLDKSQHFISHCFQSHLTEYLSVNFHPSSITYFYFMYGTIKKLQTLCPRM